MRKHVNSTPVEYRSLAHFPVDDFVAIMDKLVESEGGEKRRSKFMKGRKSQWYHLIMTDQLVCPASGKKVAICSYDIMEHKKSEPTFHFNFYTEDWELFTIDHKIPLRHGGANHNSNVQPMIGTINWEKGSELIYT